MFKCVSMHTSQCRGVLVHGSVKVLSHLHVNPAGVASHFTLELMELHPLSLGFIQNQDPGSSNFTWDSCGDLKDNGP